MKKPQTYQHCKQCGFWVTVSDAYCPNCKTMNNVVVYKMAWIIWFLSFLVLSGMTAQVISLLIRGGISVFIGILVGGIVSIIILSMFANLMKRLHGVNIFARSPKSSLQHDEQMIQQRLTEIKIREQPIITVRQKASQIKDSRQQQKVEQILQKALTTLYLQRDQYRAKVWEIQLIRWHNTLKPLLALWETHQTIEYDRFYQELTGIRQQGENILIEWERSDLVKTSEGQQHIQRLKQALNSCDQLYQDIVAQQATESIKGISRFEATPQTSSAAQEALEEIEVLNTLPDVDAFSLGLNTLEQEYFRLKSEDDIAKQLKF